MPGNWWHGRPGRLEAVRRSWKRGLQMKSIRHLAGPRRVLVTAVAASGLAAGLAVGVPTAHADPGCTWAPITLVNNWHSEQGTYDTGDPSVCLESDGMVYLSGSVAAPSGSTNSEFGTLPVWDWPTRDLYFDVYTLDGSYGVLRIDTDGTMYAYGGSGSASKYTSLAGISYPDAAVSQTDMTLQNGWESADGVYNTGDPAYSVTNGIVHLSGSLWRPAGSPVGVPYGEDAAVLPSQAVPSDSCFYALTYNYGGSMWRLGIQQSTGDVFDALNYQYISLAGINYPTGPTAWQPLPLLNGSVDKYCNYGAAYYINDNVVYLTGFMEFPKYGFTGEIAVLPPAARPSHYLYMIAYNDAPGPAYVTLTIDPDGSMWISGPQNGETGGLVTLSGLSFHLLS